MAPRFIFRNVYYVSLHLCLHCQRYNTENTTVCNFCGRTMLNPSLNPNILSFPTKSAEALMWIYGVGEIVPGGIELLQPPPPPFLWLNVGWGSATLVRFFELQLHYRIEFIIGKIVDAPRSKSSLIHKKVYEFESYYSDFNLCLFYYSIDALPHMIRATQTTASLLSRNHYFFAKNKVKP